MPFVSATALVFWPCSTICLYINEAISCNINCMQTLFDNKSIKHNVNELLVLILTVCNSSSIKNIMHYTLENVQVLGDFSSTQFFWNVRNSL